MPADRSSPRARPTTRSPGCPRRCSRASRAPASPTSARSSSAPARSRCSFKDKNITTAADLKGKKVGNWGFGNEFELFAGHDQGRARPGQGRHARPAAVRHAGAAEGRHRRRPGDDLQRVRPGAGGQEPGRPASSTRPTTSTRIDWNDEGTAMLQDAIWANTEKLERQGLPGPDGRSSCEASFKGWIVLPRQRREVPRHRRRARLQARREPPAVADERDQQAHLALARTASAWSTRPPGTRRSTIAQQTKNQDGDTVLTKAARGPGLHQRLRPEGARRAQGRRRGRRHRDGLQADHGQAQPRRRVERPRPTS